MIDLEVQKAQSRQAQSEATRFEKRVEDEDYSDPKELKEGTLTIRILKEKDED